MIDPHNTPAIGEEELTTRYIVSRQHVNKQTRTVKAEAFVPHPYTDLSVTRLIEITDAEVWSLGENVARVRVPPRTLQGRGDVLAATFLGQQLQVVPDPVEGNPNHAIVTGWADDEPGQLMVAKEIAAVAKFVPVPMS